MSDIALPKMVTGGKEGQIETAVMVHEPPRLTKIQNVFPAAFLAGELASASRWAR